MWNWTPWIRMRTKTMESKFLEKGKYDKINTAAHKSDSQTAEKQTCAMHRKYAAWFDHKP